MSFEDKLDFQFSLKGVFNEDLYVKARKMNGGVYFRVEKGEKLVCASTVSNIKNASELKEYLRKTFL